MSDDWLYGGEDLFSGAFGESRRCRKCGRYNTHRLVGDILVCGEEEADEDDWEYTKND